MHGTLLPGHFQNRSSQPLQVEVPKDYHYDQELAVFHEVLAKETCLKKCKDKEVTKSERFSIHNTLSLGLFWLMLCPSQLLPIFLRLLQYLLSPIVCVLMCSWDCIPVLV